jgi:hypothetical protein
VNLGVIRERFDSYLDEFRNLSDIAPFLLAYIRLLLLFKNELSEKELNVILERQKQLRGEEFKDEGFDEMRNLSSKQLNRDVGNNVGLTKEAMLNRLLFCALLDTEEPHFFYLTEPMFDFVRVMEVTPDQLKQILESEFVGFKI